MKTKVNIVSGFLGAGKTSFIKDVISKRIDKGNVVVIENEFGEIGIDGDILKRYNLSVKEIYSGCICCSLTGEFSDAIDEIIEDYNPETIIIEPSGVAMTSEIINGCLSVKDKVEINYILNVINSSKHKIYLRNFKDFYMDQIKCANINLLTRTNQLDDISINELNDEIRGINTHSNIVYDYDFDFSMMENENSNFTRLYLNSFDHAVIDEKHHHHSIEDHCFFVNNSFSKEDIRYIFDIIKESNDGNILRAKGFLNNTKEKSFQIDYVAGDLSITEVMAEGPGRICFIGSELDEMKLKDILFLRSR